MAADRRQMKLLNCTAPAPISHRLTKEFKNRPLFAIVVHMTSGSAEAPIFVVRPFSLAGNVVLSVALLAAALYGAEPKGVRAMALQSSAFQTGADIPKKHTCDANDVSPPLAWNSPPPGARALALIADDPDAPVGTWVHWVIYDLPAETRELAEAIAKTEILENGAKQGTNDFHRVGYGGPCPPPGPPHRYFFKLYALDATTGLKPRATKQSLLDAIKGHVLAEAQLVGRYKR